jgi:hypothetical protein
VRGPLFAMRIVMHNKTIFLPISVDNLATVTGGYHDQSGAPTPRRSDPPPPPSTLTAHVGEILKHFADLASKAAPQK